MKTPRRAAFGNVWLFGAVLVWSLLFFACASVDRTVVAPTQIAGADYVGNAECATCHSEVIDGFKHATHANLSIPGPKGMDLSCEACHGAGSKHAQAGGGRGSIVNPGKEPEVCFQCHLDKRGEFSLPNAHPVLAGKVSCTDCHNPHKGRAIENSGAASLGREDESCTRCHSAQAGPFVFKHNAMVEGCTACHNPHGSVNQKMLIARDNNLCLRCHLEHPATVGDGTIVVGGENHRTRLVNGTCWIAGCHEAVHGSNASKPLRY